MGCSSSLVNLHKQTTVQICTTNGLHAYNQKKSEPISLKQKKLLIRSWRLLSNDMVGRGSRIFLRIFEIQPCVKMLFPFGKLGEEDLKQDVTFKGHASRFMQALGAVMDNIDNYEEALSPLLCGLGKNHIHLSGFQPSYFNAFLDAILYVWKEDLDHRFTDECRDAWITVLNFIQNELKNGYLVALKETIDTTKKDELQQIDVPPSKVLITD